MSLTESYRKHAVETHLVEPLEQIFTAKWADDLQRMAYIAELSRVLATENQAELEGIYNLVIKNHTLVRFPSIAHIMRYRAKATRYDEPAQSFDIERLRRMDAMGIHLSDTQRKAIGKASH